MKDSHRFDKASILKQADQENEDFVRKPYKKNLKTAKQEPNPSDDNNTFTSYQFKLPYLHERVHPETTKNRKGFNQKIFELLEFGLNPEMPSSTKNISKFRQGSQSKLLISDFITKKVQKKILSYHKLDYDHNEHFDKNEKNFRSEVPSSGSFTGYQRKNSLFLRSTQSSQTLPPIIPIDQESLKLTRSNFIRDENLKKIDKILDGCNFMLQDKKKETKRIQSQFSLRNERKSN